jgi:hypothetical protein
MSSNLSLQSLPVHPTPSHPGFPPPVYLVRYDRIPHTHCPALLPQFAYQAYTHLHSPPPPLPSPLYFLHCAIRQLLCDHHLRNHHLNPYFYRITCPKIGGSCGNIVPAPVQRIILISKNKPIPKEQHHLQPQQQSCLLRLPLGH